MANSLRLLFVDDDFMTIESVVEYLQMDGHDVDVADTVGDALDKLQYNSYSVIFLDVMMAVGDVLDSLETVNGHYSGLKVLELIRNDDRFQHHKNTRVVLITNWREEARVDEAAAQFSALVLRKPLDLSEVEKVMP